MNKELCEKVFRALESEAQNGSREGDYKDSASELETALWMEEIYLDADAVCAPRDFWEKYKKFLTEIGWEEFSKDLY